MNTAEHLELYLGPIAYGWSSKTLPGVQVCSFSDQPMSGFYTLATLGLSNVVLSMSEGRQVRQELLFAMNAAEPPERYAKLLLHVAENVMNSQHALLRGDFFTLGSEIAESASANALYVAVPSIYPDAFATLQESAPPTVFVWLIPLLPSEVAFIRKSGWEAFEDRLEAEDPNLCDLDRQAVA